MTDLSIDGQIAVFVALLLFVAFVLPPLMRAGRGPRAVVKDIMDGPSDALKAAVDQRESERRINEFTERLKRRNKL